MPRTIRELRARRRSAELRARRVFRRSLLRRLYRDPGGGVERTILVAGTGRSGTTWLADLIDAVVPTRLMFEPFHSRLIEPFRSFPYFPYRRPDASDEALREYAERVFTGRIRHPWVDRAVSHLRAERRVVKEIRANLFLKWIRLQFSEVPLVFIVRHPCAVVASRIRCGWATDGDLAPMLEQPELVEDYLAEHRHVIEAAERPEEKHALIWCIHNVVPLSQLSESEYCRVAFERLVSAPHQELARVLEFVGCPARPLSDRRVGRPATTSLSTSAAVRGENPLNHWRASLSSSQEERIRAIVEGFGLGGLYRDPMGPVG